MVGIFLMWEFDYMLYISNLVIGEGLYGIHILEWSEQCLFNECYPIQFRKLLIYTYTKIIIVWQYYNRIIYFKSFFSVTYLCVIPLFYNIFSPVKMALECGPMVKRVVGKIQIPTLISWIDPNSQFKYFKQIKQNNINKTT